MNASPIDPVELKNRLEREPAAPVVVDVRLQDDYAAEHIPGAVSNCVFEVAFLERLPNQAPHKSRPVCVYGSHGNSHEASMAAEKLIRSGYQDVLVLRNGLAGWEAAGLGLRRGGPRPQAPVVRDGSYQIDTSESRVEWTGRNLINRHWGTIDLKRGHLEVTDGLVRGGEFILDMHTIRSADLAGDPLHRILIAHLESDDFFDVAKYPEARFVIHDSHVIANGAPGSLNLHVTGELTMKDSTEPVEIPVTAGPTEDGRLAAQSAFSIDRTQWNVLYGSGSYFARLAGHLVNDQIDLQLRILTA